MKQYLVLFALLGLIALSSCAHGKASVEEPVPDEIADYYSQRIQIIGAPDFKSNVPNVPLARVSDRRKAYRMISLRFPQNVTEKWADDKARELKEQGFNFVISEGCRYLLQDEVAKPSYNYAKDRTLDQIIKDSNTMIEACHRHGLEFIHHLTCTMVDVAIFEKHPGWKAINLRTGNSDINAYGTANTCINNDEFWEFWFAKLRRLLTETNSDGIMIDEIQYFGSHLCGCNGCREKFHKDTGFEAPVPKQFSQWLNQKKDAAKAWTIWRADMVDKRHLEAKALVRAINPDATYSIYLCNNSSGYGYHAAGLEITRYIKYGDSVGLESEPHNMSYIHYWPLVFGEMKFLRAVAEYTGNPFWTLFYNQSPGADILTYLCGLSQGTLHWAYLRDKDEGRGWKPMVQWEAEHQNLLADSHAYSDVAILFSIQTRDRNEIEPYIWLKSHFSLCNAFTYQHVPYRAVIDRDLEDGHSLLHKASTLVAIDVACWNERQVAGVKDFVKAGGTLVTGANVALSTPDFKKHGNFAIRELLGFDYDGALAAKEGEAVFVINDAAFGKPGTRIPYKGNITKIKNLDSSVKVAAEFVFKDGKKYPALLIKQTGKGKTAYFAGVPYNCYFYHYYNEANLVPGEFWKDRRDPQWEEFFGRLARFNVEKPVLKTNNIPRGVIVEAHRQAMGSSSSIQIHFANLLGAMHKEGKQPKLLELSFPAIGEKLPDKGKPMTVSVRAPKAHDLFFYSPDFDEIVACPFTREGDYVNFTLPEFQRYLIVYLAEGSLDELVRLGRPLATTLPNAKPLLIKSVPPLAGKYNSHEPTVFADTDAFQGGVKWKNWMSFEPITILYGDISDAHTVTVTIETKEEIKNPELVIGGMDDNRETSRAPVRIQFQDKVLHDGVTDYPDNKWAVRSFPIGQEILPPGKYTVTLKNTGAGPKRSVPWFGVSFVRIRAGKVKK